MPASPRPSGRKRPAWTACISVSSPLLRRAATVRSTSFRWTCATRSKWSRAKASGSTPPISRWPGSRHQPALVAASSASTCSARSTSVPTWGWMTVRRPSDAVSSASASTWLPSRRQPASPSGCSGSDQSSAPTIASTNVSAPAAAIVVATRRARASAGAGSASCRTSGTKPPTSVSACGSSAARIASASSGSQSSIGPSSVAPSPTCAISAKTRSGGSIAPQPGTSQTPHEIGAPATLASPARPLIAPPSTMTTAGSVQMRPRIRALQFRCLRRRRARVERRRRAVRGASEQN